MLTNMKPGLAFGTDRNGSRARSVVSDEGIVVCYAASEDKADAMVQNLMHDDYYQGVLDMLRLVEDQSNIKSMLEGIDLGTLVGYMERLDDPIDATPLAWFKSILENA